jgi:hypothetical protein
MVSVTQLQSGYAANIGQSVISTGSAAGSVRSSVSTTEPSGPFARALANRLSSNTIDLPSGAQRGWLAPCSVGGMYSVRTVLVARSTAWTRLTGSLPSGYSSRMNTSS